MKGVLLTMMAAAIFGTNALAAPADPFQCDIVCIEPSQHDPKAAASCNCAEKYCPTPEGPGGPNIPAGYVWGWDQEIDACGPVPDGDQCAGLDVECVSHYSYRWNGVDTCQCLPLLPKRVLPPTCPRLPCILPSQHDDSALPTDCNCADKYCPTPQGPGGPNIPAGETWAYNATSNACGPVFDPEAECLSLGVQCIANWTYGWYGPDSACMCVPDYFHKRDAAPSGPVCRIACILPRAYDPNAVSPTCNCAERICPPGPECPVDTTFGWDQDADACGCVTSPEDQCVATGIDCVDGYTYGWDAADSRCKCLAN